MKCTAHDQIALMKNTKDVGKLMILLESIYKIKLQIATISFGVNLCKMEAKCSDIRPWVSVSIH